MTEIIREFVKNGWRIRIDRIEQPHRSAEAERQIALFQQEHWAIADALVAIGEEIPDEDWWGVRE